jgi:hypothetical protein
LRGKVEGVGFSHRLSWPVCTPKRDSIVYSFSESGESTSFTVLTRRGDGLFTEDKRWSLDGELQCIAMTPEKSVVLADKHSLTLCGIHETGQSSVLLWEALMPRPQEEHGAEPRE